MFSLVDKRAEVSHSKKLEYKISGFETWLGQSSTVLSPTSHPHQTVRIAFRRSSERPRAKYLLTGEWDPASRMPGLSFTALPRETSHFSSIHVAFLDTFVCGYLGCALHVARDLLSQSRDDLPSYLRSTGDLPSR